MGVSDGGATSGAGDAREWIVAGALLEASDHLLLVRNLRRGGHSDWSTPGGVIDAPTRTSSPASPVRSRRRPAYA